MAAKKTARKAPKKAAKKAAKKSAAKSAKKSTARKSAKKVAKKSAKRSSKKSATYKVPPVPVSGARSSVSTISTTPKPADSSSYAVPKKSQFSSGSSSKVIIAVVLGIIILAVAVVAKSSSNNDEATTVTPTPAASESAMPSASASATSAPLAAHAAPIKIVAHYTASGATVFWKAPETATEGITGYNLELRAGNSGEWKLVATVPVTQFSQDITKTDATGWAQVKVSTVYSDGEVVAGKIFGLPGSWA